MWSRALNGRFWKAESMPIPDRIVLNAATDDGLPVDGELSDDPVRWALRESLLSRQLHAAPEPESLDWRHPTVGWGVVLAFREGMSDTELAKADDAPPAIRRLLEARAGSPILRYAPADGFETLRRYEEGGYRQLTLGFGPFGTAPGRLPVFMLIVGGPDEIPWRMQFAASRRHFVGRLALDDEGLERYVDHLLSEWADARPSAGDAVVWSTAYDGITDLMGITIAQQVATALDGDDDLTVHRMAGDAASGAALIERISSTRPALVVTTSHGRTGPLDDVDAMRARLGTPVDQSGADLDADALVSAAALGGSVWFAYACCSAGSDDGTSFAGLVKPGSRADIVTQAVGRLGAGIAPLPTRLLSADPPIAAFVGHVEPTFDWSLLLPTGAHLVGELVAAMYPQLYRGLPVGRALGGYYLGVNQLYGSYANAVRDVDAEKPGAEEDVLYYALTARDRESLVVLGDPTVMVPPLPA